MLSISGTLVVAVCLRFSIQPRNIHFGCITLSDEMQRIAINSLVAVHETGLHYPRELLYRIYLLTAACPVLSVCLSVCWLRV